MAISKKGRRTLVVEGASYLWWIEPERDDAGHALHLVSDDNELHLLVSTAQRRPDSIVVISLGDRLGARRGLRGPWRRFIAPMTLPAAITPVIVRSLIEWATSPQACDHEVVYDGTC